MSQIEEELINATGLTAREKEDRQKYLSRMMRAVTKLPDDDWADLSNDAQTWTNDAATAHKEGKSIPEFPDLDDVEDQEDLDDEVEQEDIDDQVEEESVDPETGEIEDAPEKEEQTAKPKRSGGKRHSACHTIKMMVIKKPSITVKELSDKLKTKDLKVSDVTIATIRSDTRDTLRVLNEVGGGHYKL